VLDTLTELGYVIRKALPEGIGLIALYYIV